MQFFFIGVVEYEIGITEGYLVVKFMCPSFTQIWEWFRWEASKHRFISIDVATQQYENIWLILSSLYEGSKLCRINSWSLLIENQLPLAIHHLLEIVDLVRGNLLELLHQSLLLLLIENFSLHKELRTLVLNFIAWINRLQTLILFLLVEDTNTYGNRLLWMQDGHNDLIDEVDITLLWAGDKIFLEDGSHLLLALLISNHQVLNAIHNHLDMLLPYILSQHLFAFQSALLKNLVEIKSKSLPECVPEFLLFGTIIDDLG
jgi:hypothetical protein